MKLRSMKLKNLTSYRDEIINFDDFADLTCITGPNGAGKSSIIDGMMIALFNRARSSTSQGTGVEKLVTLGEESLEVDFEFEIDGQNVRVIRRRFTKGGQELELYIDGINHTDKIKETQLKLESLIKMDFETFLDSVCISQGKSSNFMEKPANERKEVFTQILSLDKYDVLQEYTKELRKESKEKISKLKEKLEDIADIVKLKSQYDNEILQGSQEIDQLSIDISLKDDELELELKEKTRHEQLMQNRNELLKKKQNLENKISTIQESINKGKTLKQQYENIIVSKDFVTASLDSLSKELLNCNEKYSELNSQYSTLSGTNSVLTSQAKEIKDKYTRLKDYNEASCNFCGQGITESHKQNHLDEMMNEAKGYMAQIKSNSSKMTELSDEMSKIKLKISTSELEIKNLQNQKSQIEQADAKLSSIVIRLQELESDLNSVQSEYNEIASKPIEEVENKIFRDSTIRFELNNLRSKLTEWQNKVAIAKNELEKIAKDEAKITKLETQLKDEQEEYALLDDLTTAWGKEGIQAIIIDNSLEDIQTEINDVLRSLTNDEVEIEFITQKEKGKGKKTTSIETLDIIVSGREGSRAYETYSGGEKFRVDFACHVGLAKFLAKRAGASIDFFIVDEGVGSQDEIAKENFVAVMNKLTTFFDKVMIITHIPDVIDSFQNKVEIYKDPIQGSKIRIIS